MSWYTSGAASSMITNIGNNTATGGLLGATPAGVEAPQRGPEFRRRRGVPRLRRRTLHGDQSDGW